MLMAGVRPAWQVTVVLSLISFSMTVPVLGGGKNDGAPVSARPDAAQAESPDAKDRKEAERTEAEQKEKDEVTLEVKWEKGHPVLETSDGNFKMRFGGRMQLDYRGHSGSDAPPGSFFVRRARLYADGHVMKYFEYKVQADFAGTSGKKLRDAYLNINYTEKFQFKAGHFKAPFSQEELQSSNYMDFVERSSVNNLAPGRTPGVMLHGKAASGRFEYALGAFNGQGTLGDATAARPEVFLRLRATPWKSEDTQFSFGGAASSGRNLGGDSFRGRTSSRSFTFFDPVPVNGDIRRANAEFWLLHKSFSFRGEYTQTNQFREGLGLPGGDLPGIVGRGFVFQTTYLLTREKKGLMGVEPSRDFREGGGLGAWEVALRFERLQMDDRANSNHATAWTAGVNWWLNRYVRAQANFALERFNDPARAPEPGDTNHAAFLARIQVIF